jgi:hypothetical protein
MVVLRLPRLRGDGATKLPREAVFSSFAAALRYFLTTRSSALRRRNGIRRSIDLRGCSNKRRPASAVDRESLPRLVRSQLLVSPGPFGTHWGHKRPKAHQIEKKNHRFTGVLGADDGIRTHDLLHGKDTTQSAT